jgi:hypothetical protein
MDKVHDLMNDSTVKVLEVVLIKFEVLPDRCQNVH